MSPAPSNARKTGSRSLGGRDARKTGGWWKWLLLLLGLLILAAILIALLSGSDDDKSGSATTGAATPTTTTPATTSPDTAASGGAASGGAAPGEDGTLVAGGETLLGSKPDTLTAAAGEQATGTALNVVSVATSGFWVGTSAEDRTFVEYGARVGDDENETYKAKVGDTVDLTGPVRPAPKDPASTLKLEENDATQLTEQGAYVNATSVTPR